MFKRIMVVDDSPFIFEEMKLYLEGTDYELTAHAKDGQTALDTYKEGEFDIVTMDVIMPGMDGFEAAEKLLSLHPSARIVIVSSLAYDETIDRAKRLGAKGYLFKPIEKELLIAALDEASK